MEVKASLIPHIWEEGGQFLRKVHPQQRFEVGESKTLDGICRHPGCNRGLCKSRGLVGKGKEKREKTDESNLVIRAWGLGGSGNHRRLLHLFSWHCVALWLVANHFQMLCVRSSSLQPRGS